MNLALSRGIRISRPEWRWRAKRPFALARFPRRRVVVMAVLWIAGVVAFAGGLLQTSLFTVDRVYVAGSSHLSRDDILSLAKIKTGGSISTVNTRKAEQRLEAHPWVLHARVDVHWPHVVDITIVEQRAVAVAQTSDKKWAQLGPDGTVLSVGDKPAVKLPAVLGVSAPDQIGGVVDHSVARLMSVATLMPESLQPRVVQMQDQNGVLRLGLDAGTVVTLGDSTNLGDKLLSAASVLSHTDPKTLAELDVTSARFPVARPVAQTTTAPAMNSAKASGSSTTLPAKSKSSKTTLTTVKKTTTTIYR